MSKSKTTWLNDAKHSKISHSTDVVVDRFGLIFHNPEKLKSTIDMEEKTLENASKESVPCSSCFPNLYTSYQVHQKTK